MVTTKEWAASHGICVSATVPPISDYQEPYFRTAKEIAIRTIVLHSVVAVGYGVEAAPVVDWLKEESIWERVSPAEQAFLTSKRLSKNKRTEAQWRQEAQWALLWAIGKVKSLGLPVQTCDTKRLVDEIMPGLGDDIQPFVLSAKLRSPGELLAEDDRNYNLHCYARQDFRKNNPPDDFIYEVLYQRHYALEWLKGEEDWDDVSTDT